MTIAEFDGAAVRQRLVEFTELLADSVASGASIGFLDAADTAAFERYWHGVADALDAGGRKLLAAIDSRTVLGAVQLDLAGMPNGRHRAEVMKLMVRSAARRRGIGRALMNAMEEIARREGRTLLVLDTREGDAASALYRSIGYHEAGAIPGYARSVSGEFHTTVFFYRDLNTT